MSKLLTLILTCVICSLSVQSQRASITVGEEDKTKISTEYYFTKGKGTDIIRLSLLPDKHGVGGFARYSHTPLLSIYNKRMEVTKEAKLPELDVNTDFDQLIAMGNKIYLFTNRYEKDSKATSFFCQPINRESLEPEGASILLGKFDMSKLTGSQEFTSNGNHLFLLPGGKSNFDQQVVNFFRSSDSTKLLVAVSAPRAISENEKYYVGVYDNNMTKIWDRTIELPYQSKFVDLQSMTVTNNGEVCAVIKHYQTEKPKEQIKIDDEKVPGYTSELLVFEKDDPTRNSYTIDLQKLFVHSMELSDSRDGLLHIFGLYQQSPGGNCQGFFNASVQLKTKEQLKPKLTAFSDELISAVISEKQGSSKGSAGIGNEYRIVEVVERSNGSKDYLLEYFTTRTSSRTENTYAPSSGLTNTTTTVTPHYFFGNIIDVNIKNADGNAIVTKIPRFQPFSNFDLHGGLKAVVQNDKLLILFNDDEGNIVKKANESPRFGKLMYTTVMQMVAIDGMGAVKRSLVSNPESGRTVAVQHAIPLTNNTIAVSLYGMVSAGSTKMMPGILTIR